MKITLTNSKIYTYAIHIKEFCDERAESLMPARCSFYIYKNLNTLIEAAGCIDKARQNILEKYGTQQDEDKFNIDEESRQLAQDELNDLSEIEQEIDIHYIYLQDLNGVDLSVKQISNISFMLKDKEIEEEN